MSHEYCSPAINMVPDPEPPRAKTDFYTISDFMTDISALVGSTPYVNVELQVAGAMGAPEMTLARVYDEDGITRKLILKVD